MHPPNRIRNFSIIAHVDHGKSTLADRLIEVTGALEQRQMTDQVLDNMDIERERGITIKAQTARLPFRGADGQEYLLNLIDTPGHVDFSYEVSRSLAASEGALLIVDAAQGVEAQTLANLYSALDAGLTVIPVINKIDLPNADPDEVERQIENLGFMPGETLRVSAKEGIGITEVLQALVDRVPAPAGWAEKPLRALVFDSHFDTYRGVVAHVRVVDGEIRVGQRVRFMAAGATYEVLQMGIFAPDPRPITELGVGEVGFLSAGIKTLADARVGDTITRERDGATEPLAGYRPALSMVFAGLYPSEPSQYDLLRDALEKLRLNDSALFYEPETSEALGFGFRAGFLGLLHLEVVQERLEREYDIELVTTAPHVVYMVKLTSGERVRVENPAHMPPVGNIAEVLEPMVRGRIFTPTEYVGAVMELCQERRGVFRNLEYPAPGRALLTYGLPLAEIMYDFFDQLKSRTRGYASLDYDLEDHIPSDMVKVDILLNSEAVDALSFICHRDRAESRGRAICSRLKELIPRQMFEVPIQAAIGARILARETIPPVRKDVLAKCYGGDISRKRKLLEKQKEGKKRMRRVGRVDVPQEAFMAILKAEET